MQHDLARRRRSGPLFGRRARQKRHPIHQVHQPVIIASDEAFRKNDQWKLSLGQNAGGAFKRFAIQSFAINAEAPDARQEEGQRAALHEEMPTRHDMKRTGDLAREQSQNHGIAGPAVIGGQQHAVPGFQRSGSRSAHFHEVMPKLFGQIPLHEPRPKRARRHRSSFCRCWGVFLPEPVRGKSSLPVPSMGVHAMELVGARLPKIRQIKLRQLGGEFRPFRFGQFVQHDEAFAFLFIRHAGDDECLLGRAGEFVQLFLDA
jgi:hypothetical protein